MSEHTIEQIAQLAATTTNLGHINQDLVDHVISLGKRTTTQADLDLNLLNQLNELKRQKQEDSGELKKSPSDDVNDNKAHRICLDEIQAAGNDSDHNEDNTHEAEDRRQRR